MRQLGNSDLRLTPIGYGAWAIGGGNWEFAWGAQDDDESVRTIERALDAESTGLTRRQSTVLGTRKRWLPGRSRSPHKPYVFTKCSMRWKWNRKIYRSLKAKSSSKRWRTHCAGSSGYDRPLPDSLAQSRRGNRRGMGDAGAVQGAGKGSLHRRVQLQCRADEARAEDRSHYVTAAALFVAANGISRRRFCPSARNTTLE